MVSVQLECSRTITERHAETNIPTKEAPTSAPARVPDPDAIEIWPQRPAASPHEGTSPGERAVRMVLVLPRAHRLTAKRDVERVSRMGRPVFTPNLTIRAIPNRIGCLRTTVVAGLKVSKRSNVRNRVKRLIREALRRHLPSIRTDADLVVYVKPSAVGKHYRELADEVGRALDRARLLRGRWVEKEVKSEK